VVVLDTDTVSDTQVANAWLLHALNPTVIKPHPYKIGILLLGALFYLVTRHGATYYSGHGRNILACAATDLMSEYSAYDTANNSTSTYPATAYSAAALTRDFNRVNHAISNAGIRWRG
jgi:hypothetical protein